MLGVILAGSVFLRGLPASAQLGAANSGGVRTQASLGGWIAAMEGLSLDASLRSPQSYSPLVEVLVRNGLTEAEFSRAPLSHRQIWVTQARRIVQASAEPHAAAVLGKIARLELAEAGISELTAVHEELRALDETYGPYLPVPMAQTVGILHRVLDRAAKRDWKVRTDHLTRSIRKAVASLSISLENADLQVPLARSGDLSGQPGGEAEPPVPGFAEPLPLAPARIGGAASPGESATRREFHIEPQQMALIDLTGEGGGHHVRVARFDGDQVALIYGAQEFTRLSPGETVEIGRNPPAAGTHLQTEPDPLIADHHMSLQYQGGGRIAVQNRSEQGASIAAAVGGASSFAGRYGSILGRVFASYNTPPHSIYAEILRIEVMGRLKSLYDEIRKDLDAAGNMAETQVVNLVVRAVVREIPLFDLEQSLVLGELYKREAGSLGAVALGIVGGVCRHYGLTIAALLERLVQDGVLPGKSYYTVGASENSKTGHAWAEYEDADGMVWVLDPAQRNYGPAHDKEFDSGETDGQGQKIHLPYTRFSHPAENRGLEAAPPAAPAPR